MKVKVVLAEEHVILRNGLRALFAQEETAQVVGEAATGPDAVRLAGRLGPQLVMLDIDIPELSAIEVTRQIVTARPATKVLIMSLHSGARLVDESLKAGACGYVGDDCDFAQLMTAIQAVLAGNTYLSPAVTKVIVSKYIQHGVESEAGVVCGLTSREREVLQLLAQGRTTKEIALALSRGSKTIETHRQHLMAKLNVNSIAELTKYALREGLTDLGA